MKTENEIMVRTKSCGGCWVEKRPLVEMKDAFARLIAERKTDNENKKPRLTLTRRVGYRQWQMNLENRSLQTPRAYPPVT